MALVRVGVKATKEAAFEACRKPYSEPNAEAAAVAMMHWLMDTSGSLTLDQIAAIDISSAKVLNLSKAETINAQENRQTLLMVASENGYLTVVKKLLENEDVVKYEACIVHDHDTRAESARMLAKEKAKDECDDEKWARYMSCHNIISLYAYIGDEIRIGQRDAMMPISDLTGAILALDRQGCKSMETLKDHWDQICVRLQNDSSVTGVLVSVLSEARYDYDSWYKDIKDITKGEQNSQSSCSAFSFATACSLIVLVPGIALATVYHVILYDNRLWWQCFFGLYIFAAIQACFAFMLAPFLGWNMIMEASKNTELSSTLKASMCHQGIVSALIFTTIIGLLQQDLNFDLTNSLANSTGIFEEIYSVLSIVFEDPIDTELAVEQWYAAERRAYHPAPPPHIHIHTTACTGTKV